MMMDSHADFVLDKFAAADKALRDLLKTVCDFDKDVGKQAGDISESIEYLEWARHSFEVSIGMTEEK
jgi:hypothetical protein